MKTFSLLKYCVFAAIVYLPPLSTTIANAQWISLETFRQMDSGDQKEYLISVFKDRLERSSNISVETEVILRAYDFESWNLDQVGSLRDDGNWKDRFRRKSIGLKHRVEMDRIGIDLDGTEPRTTATDYYNAAENLHRQLVEPGTQPVKMAARIDNEQEWALITDYYRQWLNGTPRDSEECYIFPDLIENAGELQIEFDPSEPDFVKLTATRKSWGEVVGKKHFWLDPSLGYAPRRYEGSWGPSEKDSIHCAYKFDTADWKLVNGVWFPLTFIIREHCAHAPERTSEQTIRVLSMEIGTVKPEDLELKFPAGTFVTDILRGGTYICDASGEPIDGIVTPFYTAKTETLANQQSFQGSNTSVWFFVVNLICLCTALAFYFRHRMKSR